MKKKLCIIACVIFVLGFSGIANATNLYFRHDEIRSKVLTVYTKGASGDRHLHTAGLGLRNKFIPDLQAILKFHLKKALEHRETNSFWNRRERSLWDRKERPAVVKEMPLRRMLSQWIDGAATQTNANISMTAPSSPPASPVPEPGTILLMGIGLVGLAGYGRRRIIKH